MSHVSNTHNNPLFIRNALFVAVSIALMSSSGDLIAQQDQQEVEEVVVTGSYIRRSAGFTAASPVTQMTAEQLESEGTINMGEVVQNMTFNAGTSITEGIQGTDDASTSFNLRGLGTRATLQLVDGKRVATDNVNVLLPTIAIQRLEIVPDGAAALYGTDAVAGVVNIIPYTSYDGVDIEYFEERDSRGDFSDREFSILAGTSISDNIDVVFGASIRQQGELQWRERPELMTAGLTANGGSNPGNHRVPLRDENGQLTGESEVRPEPSCGSVVEDPAIIGSNPFGVLFGNTCFTEFGETWNFRDPRNLSNFYGNINYDVSPGLRLSAQLNYSRLLEIEREIAAFPGGRIEDLPPVRGEQPGNPFRAMSADGRELFAVPRRNADGSIVVDGYGRPLPQRGSDGNVILAPNQFASLTSDPQGGVPFYEDVRLDAWLPFGKPRANTHAARFEDDGTNSDDVDIRNWRFAFTADFDVPFVQDWEGTAFYTYSMRQDLQTENQHFSFSALEQGLTCDVINDIDACFNPFAATDPQFRNSQAVADSIATNFRRDYEDELQTFDIILNGTLPLGDFQLPGGEIGAAIGYQRREEKQKRIPALTQASGDAFNTNQVDPQSDSRFVNSGFAELLLPVLPNLEISANFRDENFSSGQSAFIDKYGVVYEPFDWLGLRATGGEAFVAPSLSQLNAPESCGLENINDPFTSFQGFITDCSGGNPDLKAETSDVLSAGIDLNPMEGLTLSATWSEVDFSDRIVTTDGQQIADNDFAEFQKATGFTPASDTDFPPLDLLRQWINDPRSEKRIIRNPDNIEIIQRVNTSDSNAASVVIRSWDLELDYSRPIRNWGDIRVNIIGTHITDFDYQATEFDPVQRAVGKQNNNTGIAPALPEWRINTRIAWSLGPHTVSTTLRYIDDVEFDANEFSFQRFFPFSNFRSVDRIDAWKQMDVFYSYRGLQLPSVGGDLSFTLGARNVTDREAQKVGMTSGSVQELHNPLGRVIYGRINYQF